MKSTRKTNMPLCGLISGLAHPLPSWGKLSILLGSLLVMAVPSRAAMVLALDFSNPSAVVVTGTGAFAENNVSGYNWNAGVVLRGFGVGGSGIVNPSASSQNLVIDGTGPVASSRIGVFGFAAGAIINGDANLYGAFFNPSYDTATAAFTGSATFNLAAWTGTFGTSGNVFPGDSGGVSATRIGTWGVVPEPGSASLTLLGSVGLLLRRRRAAV